MSSPRNPEQNAEIRQERREQILQAALTVYVQKGYAAAEMADVADRVGLARGLVYYYFHSKRELFQALYAWMLEKSLRHARAVLVERQGRPAERLLQYARGICEGTVRDPRLSHFFMRAIKDADQVFPEGERADERHGREFRALLTAVMREGMETGDFREGEPELAASAFWGALVMNLGTLSGRAPGDPGVGDMVGEIVTYAMRTVVKE